MKIIICKCGAVLNTEPRENLVKTFHNPEGTIKTITESKDHCCPTFDFGAGCHKETRNNNLRIG